MEKPGKKGLDPPKSVGNRVCVVCVRVKKVDSKGLFVYGCGVCVCMVLGENQKGHGWCLVNSLRKSLNENCIPK